jgi:pimeloyl-ACP methyl ester carboxylesterase
MANSSRYLLSQNISIFSECLGNPVNPPCLLISGAGASAKFWSDAFCQQLIDAGYFLIRFDHRDCGLSDEINWATHPYTVHDLAEDAIAILDAYHIQKAHVVGHSMGGVIAQLLALHHPDRLLSFTSLSAATTRGVGLVPKEVMDVLLENKPTQDFASDLAGFMNSWQILNGRFEVDKDMASSYTQDLYTRSKHKVDVAWNHIRCQEKLGDLSKRLAKIAVPGLFIHGQLDPLIPLAAAIDTANATPGSQLVVVPGMGHVFFNRSLEKRIAEYLIKHFLRSTG